MRKPLRWAGTVALGLVALLAHAQPEPMKFGKPDPADLTAKPFAGDSAAAVVLCDYGISRLVGAANSIQMEFKRMARIKILTKAGFDWASVEVPLVGTRAQIVGLKACTYNLVNGAVVKTPLSSAGKYSEDLVRHVQLFRFTLPNVREGAVLEYSYTVVGPYDVSMEPWQFQHKVPVRWSEYRMTYPDFFDYKTVLQGYLTPVVREQHEGSTIVGSFTIPQWEYRWAMKDVPALADEPFITSPRDYVSRLDIELSSARFPNGKSFDFASTWEKIDEHLLQEENFGQEFNRGGFLKEDLAGVPPASAGVAARAAAVHKLVRDAVKYNDRPSIFTSAPLRRTYKELRRGNAADVNLLLLAALRAAGLDANPVLLSTRDHGRINVALPLAERFNYVVAHVALPDGQDLFLDATEPLLPAGVLPERCLSQVGRLLLPAPAAGRWVELTPGARRVHYEQVQLTLSPQGGLSGKVHEEHSGYAGADERAALIEKGEPKYRAHLTSQHPSWTVPKFAIGGRDEPTKPLTLDYEFAPAEAPGPAPASPIYLSLFEEFGSAQNPFQHAVRTFPVDFGMAQETVVMLTLTLPDGYELTEPPKPTVVELPNEGGRYLYALTSTGNSVQLTSRLILRKPVYEAADYEHLRELYRLMLAKQAEKLVIQKKA